jgi:Flp pilus assembly pilin Flp
MMNRVVRFLKAEEATTAVEYAVMLAGIVTIMIASIRLVGGESGNFWTNNQSELDTALGGGSGS